MDINLKMIVDEGCEIPGYAHEGDAGFDLRSTEDAYLIPSGRQNVGTGLRMAIPEGYVGLVCPRSGLASKKGLTVINAPGVVDSHYRGEVKVPLVNLAKKPVKVCAGDRIAQMLIVECAHCNFDIVGELDETDRGEGGFGSTGTK